MYVSKEDRLKLKHPDYWDRDPNTWGNVNDWDIYWIELPHSTTINKRNSHSALADELRVLKQIYDTTEPAYKIACDLQNSLKMENMQNNKVWMKKDQITSLKLESSLINLELEIDRKRGRQSVHKIAQQGFQIAQQGLQEYADAEFDTMKRERKKIRTEDQNNVRVSPLCAVTPPSFHFSQAQPQSSENKVADDKENKDKDLDLVGLLSSNQRLRSEEANDEPPQKQGELFTSSEEGLSHGFLSSDISQDSDDLSNSIESNDHDSDEDEFGVKDKNLFKQRFEALDNSRKWKLKSEPGRFVEDVLYKLGMQCRYHNLVHSFIINTEDTFIKNEFSEEELSEIVEKQKEQSIPEIAEEILEYINTFAKKSTKEIREALNTPHPLLGRNYDPHTNFIYDHIRTTVTDWVRILEMEPNPLTMDMPEAWFRINVWRTIDIMFSDTPYVYVVGGEKAGLACSERKNRYRTLANIGPTQRKKIGKKGDAYVRTIGSTSTDWAGSEAGHKWDGPHGTKLMKESGLSLPRTLKDIFVHLAGKIGFEEQKMRKLNIIGFVHSGAVLMRVSLDCPAGYICRYSRRNLLEVYADVSNFGKSLDVLVEIIQAKFLILQTMKIVNDLDDNSNISRWKKQQMKSNSKRSLDMPDVHPTPKKRKDKEKGKREIKSMI